MPVGPGRNPEWFHRSLNVKIGETEYVFQTLSLFDVWILWPHLAPMKRSLERGKPLDFSDHLTEILERLNPVLGARLKDPEDEVQREFKSEHIDLLINFYERQDWTRILALVEKTTAVEAEERGADPEEAHHLFILICSEAARHANMPLTDFLQQRFEFCADQILFLRRRQQMVKEEAETGHADNWREAAMKLSATFGTGAPVAVPENKQPEWMKALNRMRIN